jgi:hypothetical protein
MSSLLSPEDSFCHYQTTQQPAVANQLNAIISKTNVDIKKAVYKLNKITGKPDLHNLITT